MISGIVTNHAGVVTLTIRAAGGWDESVEAIIDTGFDRFLTLPPALTMLLGLRPEGAIRVILGDGSSALMDRYAATVIWHGLPREITVFESDGVPLLGMELLENSRVTIDVTEGGRITIEPLPDPNLGWPVTV